MRHGEVEPPTMPLTFEVFKDFIRNPDKYSLSESGKEAVKEATRKIPEGGKIGLVLVSPYLRTKETANIVVNELNSLYQKEVKTHESDLLKEIGFSSDVINETEFNSILKQKGPEGIAEEMFERWRNGQGGELPKEVEERIEVLMRYIRRIHRATGLERLLIVSHGLFGLAVDMYLSKESISQPRDVNRVLKENNSFIIKHDSSKEEPNLPGIQNDEFIILSLDKLISE